MRISGTIVHGKGLGRTVGMPTANLRLDSRQEATPEGVWASIVHLADGDHIGVTNIGRRPSVDDDEVITIETNIHDFDEDIYDQHMDLDLCVFLRPVMRLDGLEAVSKQVAFDMQRAVELLSPHLNSNTTA